MRPPSLPFHIFKLPIAILLAWMPSASSAGTGGYGGASSYNGPASAMASVGVPVTLTLQFASDGTILSTTGDGIGAAHTYCKTVLNSDVSDVFIPFATISEWGAFMTKHPSPVALTDCVPPTTTTLPSGTTTTTTLGANSDCVGSWGGCSAACGPGLNTYTITSPKTGSGAACPFNSGDTMACNNGACGSPIDCVGSWSACDQPCGPGSQTFSISVVAQNGGALCPSANGATQACDLGACATTTTSAPPTTIAAVTTTLPKDTWCNCQTWEEIWVNSGPPYFIDSCTLSMTGEGPVDLTASPGICSGSWGVGGGVCTNGYRACGDIWYQ